MDSPLTLLRTDCPVHKSCRGQHQTSIWQTNLSEMGEVRRVLEVSRVSLPPYKQVRVVITHVRVSSPWHLAHTKPVTHTSLVFILFPLTEHPRSALKTVWTLESILFLFILYFKEYYMTQWHITTQIKHSRRISTVLHYYSTRRFQHFLCGWSLVAGGLTTQSSVFLLTSAPRFSEERQFVH